MNIIVLLLLILISISCQNNTDHSTSEAPSFTQIPSPGGEGGEPNIFVSADGQAYLSWVAYQNDTTDALLFSKLEKAGWTTPQTIASGSDWFVNWADFPSLVSFYGTADKLTAHWLQKSANGAYDYDVHITMSKDAGKTWSSSFIPHRDSIAAEHGFTTLVPLKNGRILGVWLDGRNTKGQQKQDNAHSHGGAMTLRTAEFDEEGNLFEEAELDHRVCDCCQTDAAVTAKGPVVIYRDRSEDEIRDISIVRKIDGQWTEPQKIYDDHWQIAGCPVNGPAIAALGNQVVIAWFTAAEGKNRVKVIFSNDSGQTFTDPVQIDDGNPIGRVDIALMDRESAVVSWIEQIEENGEIRLAKVSAAGIIGASITAGSTSLSRQSGFPILEKCKEKYILAWTHMDTVSTVKTMHFSL